MRGMSAMSAMSAISAIRMIRTVRTTIATIALAVLAASPTHAADSCAVTFRLTTAVELTDIQFDVVYTGSPDAHPADVVDGCLSLVSNAALAFNDDVESQILTVGLIRPQLFPGPTDIAACQFAYDSVPPLAADLVVNVTAADTLPEGGGAPLPIDPLPDVIVTDIECGAPTTTTTSTTTTTTSTTVTTSTTTTTASSTTTLPVLGGSCLLTLDLHSSQPLGALAFDIDYAPALMSFVAVPGGHHCVAADPGHNLSTEIDADTASLRVALVAGSSAIAGNSGIAHCYLFYVGDPPGVEDFDPTTVLALPLPGEPSSPTDVVVGSKSIQCPAENATTTTLPTASTTTTTLPSTACAGPLSGSTETSAADALYILKAMFGEAECDLCICDVNGSGMITIVDVQVALHLALELPATADCPACD